MAETCASVKPSAFLSAVPGFCRWPRPIRCGGLDGVCAKVPPANISVTTMTSNKRFMFLNNSYFKFLTDNLDNGPVGPSLKHVNVGLAKKCKNPLQHSDFTFLCK